MAFTDNGMIEFNQYYKYRIVNIPDEWLEMMSPEALSNDMLSLLGSCEM